MAQVTALTPGFIPLETGHLRRWRIGSMAVVGNGMRGPFSTGHGRRMFLFRFHRKTSRRFS